MQLYFRQLISSAHKRSTTEWLEWFVEKIKYRTLRNVPVQRKIHSMAKAMTKLGIPPAKVLYKSDKFVVIDKDFDVKMNSNVPVDLITVDKQLSNSFPEAVDAKLTFGFRFQQRLDHATSGVLCVGLDKPASVQLAEAFSKRYAMKNYLALVYGHVEPQYSYIDVPLCRKDRPSFMDAFKVVVATHEEFTNKTVKDCQTFVVRLETGTYDGKPASKLLLIPFTGRTHQLRVHCQHMGNLIVGDYTYSNREDTEPFRMMLHAYRLRVALQVQTLDVTAPDPFLNEIDSKWRPVKIHLSYDESFERLYDENFNFRMPDEKEIKYYVLKNS